MSRRVTGPSRLLRWSGAWVLVGVTTTAPACLVDVGCPNCTDREPDGGVSGDASAGARELGDRCDAVERCALGLECLLADARPLGTAGGLCTKPCTRDADCPSSAWCVSDATSGLGRSLCLEKCFFGDGNPRKCHGRRDVGCLGYHNGRDVVPPACIPFCNRDEDCPRGRWCDRGSGQCTDDPKRGAAPLSICASPTDCRGECLGRCAERCTIGAPGSCRADPAWGRALSCVSFKNAKDGDIANCMPDCKCHEHCPVQGLSCVVVREGKLFCGTPATGSVVSVLVCPVESGE